MKKLLFSILAAGALMFAAAGCEDSATDIPDVPGNEEPGGEEPGGEEPGEELHPGVTFFAAQVSVDESGEPQFDGWVETESVFMAWNAETEVYGAVVKIARTDYDGELGFADMPEWLESAEVTGDDLAGLAAEGAGVGENESVYEFFSVVNDASAVVGVVAGDGTRLGEATFTTGEVPPAEVRIYEAVYSEADEDWVMDETYTGHIFEESPVTGITMVWNRWDKCFESFIRYDVRYYDGEIGVSADEWLECLKIGAEENVIKLTAESVPLEGTEGTLAFTDAEGSVLTEIKVTVPAIEAPFTLLFRTSESGNATILHFDFDATYNMGSEERPAWGEKFAYGTLTAAVDGEAAPRAFVLTRTGEHTLSAEPAEWVSVGYESTRSMLAERRVVVSVEAQPTNAPVREAYLIFVPYDSKIADAAELLDNSGWIAEAYAAYPQLPVKQNAWRELPPFEFKDGYSDSFQYLDKYTPEGGWDYDFCDKVYQLTYTRYTVNDMGEPEYPTGVRINFDFAKFAIADSYGNDRIPYYVSTGEPSFAGGAPRDQFNWLKMRQTATNSPLWQISMTGVSTRPDEDDRTLGYILFFTDADADVNFDAPYAVLRCKYDPKYTGSQGGGSTDDDPGKDDKPVTGGEVKLAGDVDATLEVVTSGVIYDNYADLLNGAPMYQVTFKGAPADFKLSGLPLLEWSGDKYIAGSWMTNADLRIFSFYQYSNFDADANGAVEFNVDTEALAELKDAGESYAMLQSWDSSFSSLSFILVVKAVL